MAQQTIGIGTTANDGTGDALRTAFGKINDNTTELYIDVADNTSTISNHIGAGGTAHANVVAAGAAGFMTGADKTRLDNIANGADATGAVIHAATGKTTPADADELGIIDSAASNVLKKLTWTNLKATLKSDFDTLYSPVTGAWTAYTPSVSTGSGTLTSVTASGAYLQIGKIVFVRLNVSITTNGTAAGSVSAGLPVTPKSGVFQALFGTEANVTAKTLQGIISGSVAIMRNLDASYPGGNGYSLNLNGSYEAD